MSYVFILFQAEDGIRDYKVTGVQTCALPIWSRSAHLLDQWATKSRLPMSWSTSFARFSWLGVLSSTKARATAPVGTTPVRRSEERRVGREGSPGGWYEW